MAFQTNADAQNRYDREKSEQLNEWERAKSANAVQRSVDVTVAAVAYAFNELFRAKPDLFRGHADPFEIAARVVADPKNGLDGRWSGY